VRDYAVVPGAEEPGAISRAASSLIGSHFVARSQLAGSFEVSRGFAVIFTREGATELYTRFPSVEAFVRRLLDGVGTRALASWTDRLIPRAKPPNAFYLNLLLIPVGGSIGMHLDTTLRDICDVDDAIPELVSVLYLRAPDGEGGKLWLYDGAVPLCTIAPVPGAEVHFRGDLRHEVKTFESDDEGALRASLVCEQYALDDEALALVPPFKIQSQAGFKAYIR